MKCKVEMKRRYTKSSLLSRNWCPAAILEIMRRGRVRAFTWAPREFPEKLRYAVDLRTTIKHGIINTALTRFANVTPSSAGGNVMAPESVRAWPLTRR